MADLAGLIEGLRLGQVRIVANSYGGYISLLLALRQPELVRAMVLAEPPVHPLLRRLPDGEEMFQAFMDSAWRPAGRAFKSGDLEGGVRLFVEGAVGKGEFDRLPPGVREAMMKDAPALAMDTMTEFSAHMPELTCEDAARIEASTLLLRGELSPRMYYLIDTAMEETDFLSELARCMPHAEQALIPNASHVLHSHNSEEHNRVALEFLMRETET